MLQVILGEKRTMTQAWTKDGRRVPVSIVQAGPVVVTQVKTQEKDGYEAIQMAYGVKKTKNTTKPLLGHFKKSQISQPKAGPPLAENLKSQSDSAKFKSDKFVPRYIREVAAGVEKPEVGDVIKAVDVLQPGDVVKVTGISKGKGFQGGVKRWGFRGGPKTHGQSDRERAPGSIGQTTTPGRVMKGKRMAGRMGGEKVTIRNLTVLDVASDGVLKLSGPVPGQIGNLLTIEKIGRDAKFAGLAGRDEEVELPEVDALQEEKPEEKGDGAKPSETERETTPEA